MRHEIVSDCSQLLHLGDNLNQLCDNLDIGFILRAIEPVHDTATTTANFNMNHDFYNSFCYQSMWY